jgi:kojibiose phosphorylase
VAVSSPATFLAGVYDTQQQFGAVPELALAPDWTRLRILVEGRELSLQSGTCLAHRRSLDLRQGIAWRHWRHRDLDGRATLLEFLCLASLDDRHLLLQSVLLSPENWSGQAQVELVILPGAPLAGRLSAVRSILMPAADGGRSMLFRAASTGVRVALAVKSHLKGIEPALERRDGGLVERFQFNAEIGEVYRIDRLVAVFTSRDLARARGAGLPQDLAQQASAHLGRAEHAGPEALALSHANAWDAVWRSSGVEVEGDAAAQRALRFAIYHLAGGANPEDEHVSMGARLLTGEAYKGHVFWDTDVYMLPFFVCTAPAAARALLMYRFHTLPAALRKARVLGYRGALYPWESADTGAETTPRFMIGPDGEVMRILSGDEEHHISADVAHAVWSYWETTGDDDFLLRAGAQILVETARFWASRGQFEADGRFHIRAVIGPDEYHESIDDNAFTNGMAALNLERAAEVVDLMNARWPAELQALRERTGLSADEPPGWRRVAGAMALSPDEGTGIIEQFQGYFGLEEQDLAPMRALGKWAAPMDMLLGRTRIQGSKIIKQADVVMLLYLAWDRFAARVRQASYRYYEPRTCHGSSLSPAIYAAVAAWLGDLRLAKHYFQQAAAIDLSDNLGNAKGGVHGAALGGLWQAAVHGFGGLRIGREGIALSPRLPEGWQALRFPVQVRGTKLRVAIEESGRTLRVTAEGGHPLLLSIDGAPGREIVPGKDYLFEREV